RGRAACGSAPRRPRGRHAACARTGWTSAGSCGEGYGRANPGHDSVSVGSGGNQLPLPGVFLPAGTLPDLLTCPILKGRVMRPSIRCLTAAGAAVLAATLVAAPASAMRPTPLTSDLPRGSDVTIPHLEG